jgi:hypothetical protein
MWTSRTLRTLCQPNTDNLVPPPHLRERVDRSPAATKSIQSFRVLNIDFHSREAKLVTLQDPYSFPVLFHPACSTLVKNHIAELAQKVLLRPMTALANVARSCQSAWPLAKTQRLDSTSRGIRRQRTNRQSCARTLLRRSRKSCIPTHDGTETLISQLAGPGASCTLLIDQWTCSRRSSTNSRTKPWLTTCCPFATGRR